MSLRLTRCAGWRGLLMPTLAVLVLGTGCESAPTLQPDPVVSAPSASVAEASAPAPAASTAPVVSSPTVSAAKPDGSAFPCGSASCAFEQQCVDGACCPLLQAGIKLCCAPSEHCNVYQCYQPILCGPGLPPCGEKTYCERYAADASECASSAHRSGNREHCARMDEGVAWLAKYAPPGSTATGICTPELPPHRMGTLRWYKALGKSSW